MSDGLDDSARSLVAHFELLRKHSEEAGRRGDAATDAVRHVEPNYRKTMAELLQVDGLRRVSAGAGLLRSHLANLDSRACRHKSSIMAGVGETAGVGASHQCRRLLGLVLITSAGDYEGAAASGYQRLLSPYRLLFSEPYPLPASTELEGPSVSDGRERDVSTAAGSPSSSRRSRCIAGRARSGTRAPA